MRRLLLAVALVAIVVAGYLILGDLVALVTGGGYSSASASIAPGP
jgi:hypothetical protein